MTQETSSVNNCLISDWHGCYDESWKGVIVDEAFSHPAKYAYGLITRIVDHGLSQGYWRPGELVGDCFGGVALGGVICGARGVNWVGVELEQNFVDLGNRNLEKHGPLFAHSGATCVKLVQGDSREFARIVGEVAGVVCSPPFAESIGSGEAARKILLDNYKTRDTQNTSQAAIDRLETRFASDYGQTAGQIGSLKTGSLDAIISSPPYADGGRVYGTDPHPERAEGMRNSKAAAESANNFREGYGTTPGNIGNLKAGELTGVVPSPPFLGARAGTTKSEPTKGGGPCSERVRSVGTDGDCMGDTEGQIGNESPETYWKAVRDVYLQCHQAINPGGVIAVVVKDYVSKGERVPLCDQTAQLLESCGFNVFERTRCHLVKTTTERSLFGQDIVTTKSRKSFFRRLCEKNGSPEINWEEVIWAKNN